MQDSLNARTSPSDQTSAIIRVWDPLVRLPHWTLALGCITNLTVLRESDAAHQVVGYAVLVAVGVRVLWGFAGSRHARFADFLVTPRKLLVYVSQVIHGRAPRYVGHNPAGGLMIMALMGIVAATGITGWMMDQDAFWGEAWVEGLHEAGANTILALAVVHVLAALIESWHHRENLVRAMITGAKRAAKGSDLDHAPPSC